MSHPCRPEYTPASGSGSASWQPRFFLRDHLGSVRVIADASGAVLQRHHFYPYGADLDALFASGGGHGGGFTPADSLIIIGPGIGGNGTGTASPQGGGLDGGGLIDGGDTPSAQTSTALPYRFSGKERLDRAGLPLYDFGARWYNPVTPAWTTPDPLAEKYYDLSPYVYCAGDPVNLVDPTGCLIGDFYNTSGNYIGTDGIDDKRKYLVLSSKDQKMVKSTNKNGGTTSVSMISSAVPVPSNEVVDMMAKAYEKTENNGLEYGFRVGLKGTISSLVEGTEGDIDMTGPQNEIRTAGDYTALEVHTHPMGNPLEYGEAKPSPLDRNNALTTANNIVLGYEWILSPQPNTIGGTPSYEHVRRIGYYDKNGLISEPLHFDTYKRAVNRINKNR